MRLGLAVLQKHLTDDYRWRFFTGWLCPTCVTETWVPSWIDFILIWCHYTVICTLVTIFNWWFSSKDMKLRVLIKEVLVVFHWLTFRILLCSLASGHRVLFLVQETTQELLHIYIYIYIYILKMNWWNELNFCMLIQI